jgi:DNA-binding transcriptional regulator GbsR (MarR family)
LDNQDLLRHYVEELTLMFEQQGFPRMAGRVLAYLLICDPPHQTMNDLMDALQMSKSSVSSATITLIQYTMVERISMPGIRRDFYRVREDVWNRMLHERVMEIYKMREIAEKGLQLLEDTSQERRSRLYEMYSFYKFFEKEMPIMIQHWEEDKK